MWLSSRSRGTVPPDGSLVLFDTSTTDLAGTALSMADLADAFKATKARAVLCILDCCFSEQPGTGHGLLTHALIDAWTTPTGESVSFPEIAGEIIRLARVVAATWWYGGASVAARHVQAPETAGVASSNPRVSSQTAIERIASASGMPKSSGKTIR